MYLRVVLVLALLSGCAQKEIVLDTHTLKPLPVAAGENTQTQKYKGNLNVLNFKDDRSDKKSLGSASTGLFNKETPIQLNIPVTDYLENRFRSQLTKHGIEVAGKSEFALSAAVKKVRVFESNDSITLERSNCEIELEFDVVTAKEKAAVYHGIVSVTANGSNFALDTTSSNGAALETCAQSLAEQFLKNNDLRKRLGIKAL